jgi:predicted nucleic acid-binding protein
MIVVDASVVVELLMRTDQGRHAKDRLFGGNATLHAPHLLDVEIAHGLRRLHAAGQFDANRGREALQDLAAMRIYRYPHDLLLTRIWELRDNLTAYDATYVALAEVLRAPLLTCDRRLARAPGHSARVEILGPPR